MNRTSLPQRRPSMTQRAEHSGFEYTLTVGFDKAGQPREVFADGAKYGSDRAHVVSDACVLISLLLQHGAQPDAIAKSLGTEISPFAGPQASSIIGAIVGELQAIAGEIATEGRA